MLAAKPATYADLEKVAPNLVAEIIHGALVTHPRPAPRHARSASRLGMSLGAPFDFGQGGPGGWIIIDEPELHLGPHVVVPDLAGWRRENLPELPKTAWFETPPDWVCEVLPPATAHFDRGAKRRIYATCGVKYLWLLDPDEQVLEAFSLQGENWLLTGTPTGGESVCLAPFEAISFPLSILFPFDTPKSDPPSQG